MRTTAKTAVEGGETDAIKAKAEALAQVAMKMGQAIYEKDQQAAASPAPDAPIGSHVLAATVATPRTRAEEITRPTAVPTPSENAAGGSHTGKQARPQPAAAPQAEQAVPEAAAGFQFDSDNQVRKLGYVGNKRYTRLTITPAAIAPPTVAMPPM